MEVNDIGTGGADNEKFSRFNEKRVSIVILKVSQRLRIAKRENLSSSRLAPVITFLVALLEQVVSQLVWQCLLSLPSLPPSLLLDHRMLHEYYHSEVYP